MTTQTTGSTRSGVILAVASAATFGSSGAVAKTLIETGWSAGAAVFVRLAGGACLLALVLVAIRITGAQTPAQRAADRIDRGRAKQIVMYGAVAMAGTQLAFFNAVRTLDVGVARLLEFLAPVMLLIYTALRERRLPAPVTLVGAAATMVGLVFVLDLGAPQSVDAAGVAWGLVAALCLSGYFLMSASRVDQLPAIVMTAGGTAVGAVIIAAAGLVGIVPLSFSSAPVTLLGTDMSWWWPAIWLVTIATVTAYLTGIAAVRRLGTRPASFMALTEVLFAIVIAWILLTEMPSLSQLFGGACIVAGIIVIQRTESVVPIELAPPPSSV